MSEIDEKMEKRWRKYQELTGYTDAELEVFRSFPQNVKAIESSPLMASHELVIEVIASANCIAGYKVGDTFRIDPFGFLIKEQCPPTLCTGAIFAFKPLIGYAWQAFFDGSTTIFHNTIKCPDVGVHCGGTGEITMRAHAVPRHQPFKK
jgi:uncharacterized repeat protein (TIGR04076 family)